MQLIEIGLDHATADVTVRERLAVSSADLPGVLADLRQLAADAVVLSTCNRVEVYLLVADGAEGARRAIDYFAARSGLTAEAVAVSHPRAPRRRRRTPPLPGRHGPRVDDHRGARDRRPGSRGDPRGRRGRHGLRRDRAACSTMRSAWPVRSGPPAASAATPSRSARPPSGSASGRSAGLTERSALVIGAGSVGRSAARVLAASGVSRLLIASRRTDLGPGHGGRGRRRGRRERPRPGRPGRRPTRRERDLRAAR